MVFGLGFALDQVTNLGQLFLSPLMGIVFLLLGAGPVTLVLGVPLYLLLRTRVRPTIWISIVAGCALSLVTLMLWGLLIDWRLAILALISGASGGVTFWWTAHDEISRNAGAK